MYKVLKVNDAANLAIFHNQLPTPRAIRFIQSRAKVSRDKAISAIEKALTGYKNRA
jgi:hypothetical protein